VFHEYVFWLEIAVDDSELLEESEGGEQLDGESPDVVHIQGSEVVGLQQLVEVGGEYFSDDADVLPEDNEVLDPEQVLAILDVLLLDLHEDIDFVERQLHVLPARPHYLHRHCLPRFMVERLHHLPEGSSAQTLQQFVPIPHLLVLLPEVPALEVVLAHPASDPDVVDCLLVDQLDPLVFGQHWLEALQDLLPGQAGQRPSQVLVIEQLRLLDEWDFFLDFF
jgi:hypothetical protein